MKRFLIAPAVLLLSACSTNSQLNVVDGLTLVATNDGEVVNPSRWLITDHPLQTTYVSLNGQLGLQVGQVCTASRFRSPFTNNCRAVGNTGKYYHEYFGGVQSSGPSDQKVKSDSGAMAQTEPLRDFLEAVYKEQEAQVAFVGKVASFYNCVNKTNSDNAKEAGTTELDNKAVIDKTISEMSSSCETEIKERDNALEMLKAAQNEVRKQSMAPNRVVYNWAEVLKFEGGVVVADSSNQASGALEKQASGYTVVNGLHIQRFQLTCGDLKKLKGYGDSNRLKVVTMTLSADELYYDAREYKATALNATASFSPNELKALKDILDVENIEMAVNATLASASDLSSKGHLIAPKVGSIKWDQGLTYYAVLTDLESFQCSKNDSDSIIAMMGQADES